MHIFDVIALLIFLSGMFIFINTFYLKLPSPVGLMTLSVVLSVIILLVGFLFPSLHLAKHVTEYQFEEVLSQFILNAMLFAGALNIDFKKLTSQRTPILILSTIGVLISTFFIGTAIYYLLDFMKIHLDFIYCIVFGALISSTDPISIVKTIRQFHLPKNLELKMAGEALFTGGLAVVLALALLDLVPAHGEEEFSLFHGIGVMLVDIGGGLLFGGLLGYIGFLLLKYIDNDEVQVEVLITIALVLAGSFLAEALHISSKMSAIVMGLVIGNMSEKGSETSVAGAYVYKFWNLMEETIAVILFVLIGLEMIVLPWRFDYFAAGFFAVNIVLLGRWVSVFIPIKMMSFQRTFDRHTIPVLTWGALKGGLPIALSLSIPYFPGKDIIITMTYVVVVCSVLYQGLSLPTLMRGRFINKAQQKDPTALDLN